MTVVLIVSEWIQTDKKEKDDDRFCHDASLHNGEDALWGKDRFSTPCKPLRFTRPLLSLAQRIAHAVLDVVVDDEVQFFVREAVTPR